jgi:EpsI family protein
MQLGDWTGVPQPPLTAEVAAVLGADDYLTRAYFLPDGSGIGLFVGYWQSQRQGDTMHSPLNCLPGAGWQPMSVGMLNVADPRAPGSEITVNRVVIQKGVEKQLALYWYQSHGRVVGNEYWSKVTMVYDAFRFNRSDAALVRVVSPVIASAGGESAADANAVDFIQAIFPTLEQHLPS